MEIFSIVCFTISWIAVGLNAILVFLLLIYEFQKEKELKKFKNSLIELVNIEESMINVIKRNYGKKYENNM